MSAITDSDQLLNHFLLQVSRVTRQPIAELRDAVQSAALMGLRPTRGLLEHQKITLEQISEIIAAQHTNITVYPQRITPESAAILPFAVCQRLNVLPYHLDPETDTLTLVSPEPLSSSHRHEIEQYHARNKYQIANIAGINAGLDWVKQLTTDSDVAEIHDDPTLDKNFYEILTAGDTETSTAIANLLQQAASLDVSDIHINNVTDPDQTKRVEVRVRRLGDLTTLFDWSYELGSSVLARFSTQGLKEVSETVARDGRIDLLLPFGGRYALRINSIPTTDGEMMTLRMLRQDLEQLRDIDSVYPPAHTDIGQHLKNALKRPNGLVLLVGATGSGKSTTLASACAHIVSDTRKVVTIEDPVEARIPGAQQIPVTKQVTFSKALESTLRADPDYVLVGEIREEETAKTAFRATQTGHLLLSTLHAKSACAAPARLFELGVSHTQVSDESLLMIAQRLVKTLCRACSENGEAAGCESCNGTGYGARTALAECLIFDEEVRGLVAEGAPVARLEKAAGFIPFREHALALLRQQVTTEEELVAHIGEFK